MTPKEAAHWLAENLDWHVFPARADKTPACMWKDAGGAFCGHFFSNNLIFVPAPCSAHLAIFIAHLRAFLTLGSGDKGGERFKLFKLETPVPRKRPILMRANRFSHLDNLFSVHW